MLDAFLFLFVMGMLALGLRKPFIWVLAYLYIDIVAPQNRRSAGRLCRSCPCR
jgi:hypothetical protein